MSRIAQRAGVNKQLLFYYFGSKAGLYRHVTAAATADLERFTPEAETAPHAGSRLRATIESIFTQLAGDPGLARLVVRDAEGPGSDDLARAALARLVSEMRTVISAGQGVGYFRDDADPDAVARQAVVLVVGYLGLEEALGGAAPARRAAWVDGVCGTLGRALAW